MLRLIQQRLVAFSLASLAPAILHVFGFSFAISRSDALVWVVKRQNPGNISGLACCRNKLMCSRAVRELFQVRRGSMLSSLCSNYLLRSAPVHSLPSWRRNYSGYLLRDPRPTRQTTHACRRCGRGGRQWRNFAGSLSPGGAVNNPKTTRAIRGKQAAARKRTTRQTKIEFSSDDDDDLDDDDGDIKGAALWRTSWRFYANLWQKTVRVEWVKISKLQTGAACPEGPQPSPQKYKVYFSVSFALIFTIIHRLWKTSILTDSFAILKLIFIIIDNYLIFRLLHFFIGFYSCSLRSVVIRNVIYWKQH